MKITIEELRGIKQIAEKYAKIMIKNGSAAAAHQISEDFNSEKINMVQFTGASMLIETYAGIITGSKKKSEAVERQHELMSVIDEIEEGE